MKIKVLLFSLFRDICGSEEIELSFEGTDVALSELLETIFAKHPKMREWDEKMLTAVNCEYSSRDCPVKNGDEVALMPPVQGG